MKIALMSDIHAEFYRHETNWLPPLPDNPDVLVLAGDNHVGGQLIDFVARICDALPSTQIILIAGNHEFYRQYRLKTLAMYREVYANHKQVHFLENTSVDIEGIRFIGATLWTGFPPHLSEYSQEEVMKYAKENVNDFSLIADDTNVGKIEALTPERAKILFHESKNSISQMLMESIPAKCVVVTHFPPLMRLIHPKFPIDKVSSYFTSDCQDLIETYQPAYWFYGHNHWSSQIALGKTQIFSNQFGYPNERWKMGGVFDQNLIFQL